jgi:predicted ATP-grasp superfamily ATP-dependent carboligase
MGRKHWPTAYIMDSDPQALSIIRDLGRHGVPVITLTYKPHSPGRFSRYADTQVLPRIDEHPQVWLDRLLQEGKRQERKAVLIPGTDRFVEFVSAHRNELDLYYAIPLPQPTELAQLLDKRTQYRLAGEAGLSLPRTVYPQQETDLGQVQQEGWGFPCVLKPFKSHLWVRSYGDGSKLCIARSFEELVSAYRDASRRGIDVMVQERIPGGPDLLYSAYFYADAKSRLLAVGVGRKLRQYPMDSGNGTLRISVREPRACELAAQFVRHTGFHGIGNVEFRLDPRDGEFKLMELNTRPALGMEVVIAAGLYVPYIAYRDLIGQPVPATDAYRDGVKWLYFETDVQAFKTLRKQGKLSLIGWLRSIWDSRCFAYFAWDDLRPWLVAMRVLAWKIRRGLL